MAGSSGGFYQPITEAQFRLVHLLPSAEFDDEIQCILEPRPLGSKTHHYEALSYQWGNPSITRPIRIAHLAPSPRTIEASESLALKPWSEVRNSPSPTPNALTLFRNLRRDATVTHGDRLQLLRLYVRLPFLELFYYIFSRFLPDQPASILWIQHWLDIIGGWIESLLRIFLVPVLGRWLGGWAAYQLGRSLGRMFRRIPASFCVELLQNGLLDLVKERVWLAAYSHRYLQSLSQQQQQRTDIFTTKEVTANLESALRYLRDRKKIRTLWIDALSINQTDEAEKRTQIQLMGAIYANAWTVVVWLGEYHDASAAAAPCDNNHNRNGNCIHKRQISAAYRAIEWLSTLHRAFVSNDRAKRDWIDPALPGLASLAARGWWTRLWVFQEVALAKDATVQCGEYVCDFGDLCSALNLLTSTSSADMSCLPLAGPTIHRSTGGMAKTTPPPPWLVMASAVKEVCYAALSNQRLTLPTLSGFARDISGLGKSDLWSVSRRSVFSEVERSLSFASKLQYVLLQTAGRFSCYDDRDRLFAVIGISGGLTTGVRTIFGLPHVPRFALWYSGLLTLWTVFQRMMTSLFGGGASSPPSRAVQLVYTILYWYLGSTIDVPGWDWALSQNKILVKDDHRELMDCIGGDMQNRNPVDFFVSLAGFLAHNTGFLLFLDALSCQQDRSRNKTSATTCTGSSKPGDELPSWVPDWTAILSSSASEYAVKTLAGKEEEEGKTVALPPRFQIFGGGKMLRVWGYSRTVDFVERVVPAAGKKAKGGRTNYNKQKHRGGRSLGRVGASVHDGVNTSTATTTPTTTTGSTDNVQRREIGSLVRGRASLGDTLLHVPGNFHDLVLRKRAGPPPAVDGNEFRWRVVGLVSMREETNSEESGKRPGTTTDPEVARLHLMRSRVLEVRRAQQPQRSFLIV